MATEGRERTASDAERTASDADRTLSDADRPWTHEQAVVGDVRLHYVAAGDDEDPLVVLLHGFPEFWYSWHDQIPALADAGYRVVAPDMRGYNLSEKPPGLDSYRMEELVGDVVNLIDHFGRDEATVVGHDWGGAIAWETAIRHPERVARLAVLNAPHPERFREELRSNPEQWRRSWYMLWFQLPALPEKLLGARNAFGVGRLLRESANPGTFGDDDLRRYREAAARPGALGAAINYYRALFRQNLVEQARRLVGRAEPQRRLRVPTLLIWGEEDVALGTELTEGLNDYVSDIRVERLPGASHWVQNDRPERVNDLLVEFCEEAE